MDRNQLTKEEAEKEIQAQMKAKKIPMQFTLSTTMDAMSN